MKGKEVRQSFLNYFQSKGHTIVPSSALVPNNDPTLLFTNAGMVQFKDCFLGADKRAYTRATTCQKCLRISGKHNDFENVGVTARHHTFFEMLGNFSFGDYFKPDAIKYAWEFVTKSLGIDKNLLWVTIYEKDDEAAKLWKDLTDVIPDRIVKLGEDSNFWAMGETGPCGPCSEIHYFVGKDAKKQNLKDFLAENGDYLEFWNLVFMQYDRDLSGKLTPLPKPSVDTGMGLERTAMLLNGLKSNYDTDLLRNVISVCEKLSGFKYDGSSFEVRDLRTDKAYARDVAMRVIADHSRAASFLIADGVYPESDGRGYVLRRIIRRALRHGKQLDFNEPFFAKACENVIANMCDQYSELSDKKDLILKVVDTEERKFYETLESGLLILEKEVQKIHKGGVFPGHVAFLLHDTYGFPLDLTQDALKAYNLKVDEAAFQTAFKTQQDRSREDRKASNIKFESIKLPAEGTRFVGYTDLVASSKITQLEPRTSGQKIIKSGEEVTLFFESTPFYAESGGQVSDIGVVSLDGVTLQVSDVQKVQDKHYAHVCKVSSGELPIASIGRLAKLEVEAERRALIRTHHSATHIVHAALRKFLGSHVKQAGSRVDHERLRFDFTHFEPLSSQLLAEIQEFANSEVRNNYETNTRILAIEEAKQTGAVALFGEKYGDKVRVVEIGPNSMEFCGGTHVQRSGDIGLITLLTEGGVSAGVRRVEFKAGQPALQQLLLERAELSSMASLLKGGSENLTERLEKVLQRQKSLEKEIESYRGKLAKSQTVDLESSATTSAKGFKVVAEKVEETDSETLRGMVDRLRLKLGSSVVALACKQGDKAVLVAGVTSDLVKTLSASEIVKEAAKVAGGRGGGRPDFAQAGGLDPSLISASLNRLKELLS